MSAAGLNVLSVTKEFRRAGTRTRALDDITIDFAPGLRTGVVGESGSGKSTLARLLCGLAQPTTGRVELDGKPVSALVGRSLRDFRRDVQFVAQDFGSSFEPGIRCEESVLDPALYLRVADHTQLLRRARQLLDAFHMPENVLERFPTELSGGQRQRLSLIRGMLVQPRYLVCDEVISALDVSVQAEVLNVLQETTATSGMGLIFIAHNLPATLFLCDRIVVMYHGEVVEVAEPETLVHAPQHAYTRELLASYREVSA